MKKILLRLLKIRSVKVTNCPVCGEYIGEDVVYCPHCGEFI